VNGLAADLKNRFNGSTRSKNYNREKGMLKILDAAEVSTTQSLTLLKNSALRRGSPGAAAVDFPFAQVVRSRFTGPPVQKS
jgi:hypothetical protein